MIEISYSQYNDLLDKNIGVSVFNTNGELYLIVDGVELRVDINDQEENQQVTDRYNILRNTPASQ